MEITTRTRRRRAPTPMPAEAVDAAAAPGHWPAEAAAAAAPGHWPAEAVAAVPQTAPAPAPPPGSRSRNVQVSRKRPLLLVMDPGRLRLFNTPFSTFVPVCGHRGTWTVGSLVPDFASRPPELLAAKVRYRSHRSPHNHARVRGHVLDLSALPLLLQRLKLDERRQQPPEQARPLQLNLPLVTLPDRRAMLPSTGVDEIPAPQSKPVMTVWHPDNFS